jgi:hypothetical protein
MKIFDSDKSTIGRMVLVHPGFGKGISVQVVEWPPYSPADY